MARVLVKVRSLRTLHELRFFCMLPPIECGVVTLCSCFRRSKQYAFQVVVLGRSPLFFACDNELLRSEWIDVFARYTDDSVEPPMTHGRRSPEGGPSARQLRQSQSTSIYVDMKSEDIGQRTSISGMIFTCIVLAVQQ